MKKEIINEDVNKRNKNKKESFAGSYSYSKPTIKFLFETGEELLFDKNIFLSIKPVLSNNKNLKMKKINTNSVQVDIPNSITKENLSIFLRLINYFFNKDKKNKIKEDATIENNKIMDMLNISNIFISDYFNLLFIKDILLKINYCDIAIEVLHYSYSKLRILSEKKEEEVEVNNYYFDLFYHSLEIISKNEQIVFNNFDKIKILDKKIIDEIIEKTFKNLIHGNTILTDENEDIEKIKKEHESLENNLHIITMTQLNKLIEFLMEINNKNNFFDLITSEYAYLLSKDSLLELKNLPHPSLQVDIHFSDYSFYCQEFPLEMILNNKKILLIISYKTEDQSFNINIKLLNKRKNDKKNINSILEIDKISEEKYIEDNSYFKIFTFLTNVQITKGPEKITIATQNNLLSLSDSKTVYNILKISNFDNELRNFLIREPSKEYFSVIVQIKLCYKYSALASYLLQKFHLYYNDKNICKISKQLLILILGNKFLKINKNNEIVTTIFLWLEDEINIKEDISCIFTIIKWEEVDESLIFELIIKYSHIIVGNKLLEKMFINVFEKKYNDSKAIGNIFKSLFNAGLKIEYNKLFIQMKKSQKNNKIYKFFNSENKYKHGNYFEYDKEESSVSKDSFSFKEVQKILNESNKKENKKNKNKNYTFNNSLNNIDVDNLYMRNKKCHNQNKEIENKINKEKCEDKKKVEDGYNKVIKELNKKSKAITKNFNKIKNENGKIIKGTNAPNITEKNVSFFKINQNKIIRPNSNKNYLKTENDKKANHSYIKTMKKALKDNKNINKVSININNINNINISNNNFSNYKNHNIQPINKYNNINTNSFSLTFCSNKNNKKIKNKDNYIKNRSFKLFSTSNTDKNNIFNIADKTNHNESMLDNLLSSILKYNKTPNKSKQKQEKNSKINTILSRKIDHKKSK